MSPADGGIFLLKLDTEIRELKSRVQFSAVSAVR